MKKYKIVVFFLVFCLLTTGALAASANVQKTLAYSGVSIFVNNQKITPVDVNGDPAEPFSIDGTIYLPIRAIEESLGHRVLYDAETNSVYISEQPTQTESVLKAGAGSGAIDFPDAMFPMSEGFTTVHDAPHARVLVVENNGVKAAIVSMELVNTPEDCQEIIRGVVHDITGTPNENIIIHSTHIFSTPHAPDAAEDRAMFNEAVTAAITQAAQAAAASFQPAVVGTATGACAVTANRDILTEEGWKFGLNGDGTTDHTMTMMKFESLSGETIGLIMAYGTRSYCTDVSRGTSDREITSDLTGYACTMLEEEFGAPALFLMTAAADQSPIEAAVDEVNQIDLGVQEGLAIAEKLGTVMGNDAIAITNGITCNSDAIVATAAGSFVWPTLTGGEVELPLAVVTIGDTAIVGAKTEINCITSLQLKDSSPYENTLLVTFVNGDQSYMPSWDAYEKNTGEAQKTSLVQGAAEQLVETAAELLNAVKDGTVTDAGTDHAADSAANEYAGISLTMGGMEWQVLTVEDGKALVVAKNCVTEMGYYAAGTAVTWEESDVRAYLNGTFYDQTFSAEEKAKIIETTITNKGSSLYGTSGGNDTTDRVFLLSCDEAETYFAAATDRIATNAAGETTMWLLRTPGKSGDYVCDVNASGFIDRHGILVVDATNNTVNEGGVQGDYASNINGGIRPAMWVVYP